MTAAVTHDVIVVGGGGSGLATAIEARVLGCDMVLIEKNPQFGGSTAWSVGSVTASGTPHQARKGIEDSTQEHWRDMAGFNGDLDARDNPGLRRVLADEMPETFRWLLKGHGHHLGWAFASGRRAGKNAALERDDLRPNRILIPKSPAL